MAFRPNPDGATVDVIDDVTGATLSEGVPPDMLGSLYNPEAVAPPPVPDVRTAGITAATVGPTGVQSPIQPPGASDVTRVLGPGLSLTTSGAAPVHQATPISQAPPASATPSSPSGLPLSGLESTPTTDEARKLLLGAMQPRLGTRVNQPSKNVLRNFQVGVTPKLSSETKEETDLARELSFTRAGRLAAEGGMLASASAEDAALMYENQRQDAQNQLANLRTQERDRDQMVGARMREIDMLGDELRSKRKDAANPDAYWDDKGTFGTIMAKIGMALYAMGGAVGGYDPMGLAKQIDAEAQRYNDAKRIEVDLLGKEIEGKESQLEQVRRNFISRDAAEHATRALMNESMAAETRTLAEHYKSAEAQNTALQLVNQLQAQAAEARAAAELAEKDAITQNWQHLEAFRGVVGGSQGGIRDAMKMADTLGIPRKVALQIMAENKEPISKEAIDVARVNKDTSAGSAALQKFNMQGLVQLPQGGYGWTPHGPDAANKAQKLLHSMPQLRNNLTRIKKIVAGVSSIDKLSPEDRAELDTLAAGNAKYIKTIAEEALTSGEYAELWTKLSGGNVKDLWRLSNEEKQLDTAIGLTRQYEREKIGELRKVPPGLDPGEPLVPPVPAEADDEPQ